MSTLITQLILASGQMLALYHGDLTEEHMDAIVNAANERLAHGAGLAGAIVRRGGREIQEESNAWIRQHSLAGHDKPALTGAGRLPCKAIIHAVGPVWLGGKQAEDTKLRLAYTSALKLAHELGFGSVAFPSISTGLFGFPVERGSAIAVQAVTDFCAAHPDSPLREIRFTLIDAPTVEVFRREFEKLDKPLAK
jgi:O-acetyl-ADP-ribose deacetylase